VEFRILGPLEVRNESGVVMLGGIKQRAVLGVLLLHRSESVHSERLALALWGDDAPASAMKRSAPQRQRLAQDVGGLLGLPGRQRGVGVRAVRAGRDCAAR
jgi:hypothetical protein